MLYQTHHPFFFQFHSSNHSPSPSATSTSTSTSTSFPLLSSLSHQEMACVEGALKGSFRKELKYNQVYVEDFSTVSLSGNNPSGVVSVVEDFSIDDLFDFSKMANTKDEFLTQEHEKAQEQEEEEDLEENKACPELNEQNSNKSNNFLTKEDFGPDELAVPADDVADLEWLSHFVEDSFSEYSLTYPAGTLATKTKTLNEKPLEPETGSSPSLKSPVLGKARSKRARKTGWCLRSSTESPTESSTSSSTSSNSSPTTHLLIYTNPEGYNNKSEFFFKPPQAKKLRKKSAGEAGSAPAPRRCSHCGVTKTPQWRAGPLGAKTLCNACGVRFKSGRLLPEYRPACSPTFSSELHSNHHRKVLEMRRKKENELPESGLVHAVQSF